MRILAIDPGYDRCGVALIEKVDHNKETLLFSMCVETERGSDFTARLHIIFTEISRVIETFKPNEMALERLYFNTNQKTAMRVAEVRGMCIQLGNSYNLHIAEYTPPQIKVAVGGSGRATKKDIATMVPLLISLSKKARRDDELDAIAIGLTHLASRRTPRG